MCMCFGNLLFWSYQTYRKVARTVEGMAIYSSHLFTTCLHVVPLALPFFFLSLCFPLKHWRVTLSPHTLSLQNFTVCFLRSRMLLYITQNKYQSQEIWHWYCLLANPKTIFKFCQLFCWCTCGFFFFFLNQSNQSGLCVVLHLVVMCLHVLPSTPLPSFALLFSATICLTRWTLSFLTLLLFKK